MKAAYQLLLLWGLSKVLSKSGETVKNTKGAGSPHPLVAWMLSGGKRILCWLNTTVENFIRQQYGRPAITFSRLYVCKQILRIFMYSKLLPHWQHNLHTVSEWLLWFDYQFVSVCMINEVISSWFSSLLLLGRNVCTWITKLYSNVPLNNGSLIESCSFRSCEGLKNFPVGYTRLRCRKGGGGGGGNTAMGATISFSNNQKQQISEFYRLNNVQKFIYMMSSEDQRSPKIFTFFTNKIKRHNNVTLINSWLQFPFNK